MARVTLATPPPPTIIPIEDRAVAELVVPASRRDLHVARRLRRRDAMLGLGVLAAAEIAALVLSAAKPRSAPEPPVASKLDV